MYKGNLGFFNINSRSFAFQFIRYLPYCYSYISFNIILQIVFCNRCQNCLIFISPRKQLSCLMFGFSGWYHILCTTYFNPEELPNKYFTIKFCLTFILRMWKVFAKKTYSELFYENSKIHRPAIFISIQCKKKFFAFFQVLFCLHYTFLRIWPYRH